MDFKKEKFMKLGLFFLLVYLFSFACKTVQSPNNSEVKATIDMERFESNGNGTYTVYCKSGKQEIASTTQLNRGDVCHGDRPGDDSISREDVQKSYCINYARELTLDTYDKKRNQTTINQSSSLTNKSDGIGGGETGLFLFNSTTSMNAQQTVTINIDSNRSIEAFKAADCPRDYLGITQKIYHLEKDRHQLQLNLDSDRRRLKNSYESQDRNIVNPYRNLLEEGELCIIYAANERQTKNFFCKNDFKPLEYTYRGKKITGHNWLRCSHFREQVHYSSSSHKESRYTPCIWRSREGFKGYFTEIDHPTMDELFYVPEKRAKTSSGSGWFSTDSKSNQEASKTQSAKQEAAAKARRAYVDLVMKTAKEKAAIRQDKNDAKRIELFNKYKQRRDEVQAEFNQTLEKINQQLKTLYQMY